ncbi:ALMS1 protein, partial [Alcedo cyanopectus]|nr:ALMS1 protein [Ceyx cyanopectus]
SALSSKRRARMLNKGVQAGDLEIVSSATRKNTRDVGVTFPTPGCRRADQRPQEAWHGADGISGESDGMDTAQQAAGRKGKQKEKPETLVLSTNPDPLFTGVSWLVQAEDLKWESRKENHSNFIGGPGPSWFEPWSSTKAWREPLREKNWQEQQSSPSVHPAGAGR